MRRKVWILLTLPLVLAFGQVLLGSLILGGEFGFGSVMVLVSVPPAYLVGMVFGLPLVRAGQAVRLWQASLVGGLCALPAAFAFCYGDPPFLVKHLPASFLTLLSWVALGVLAGGIFLWRK